MIIRIAFLCKQNRKKINHRSLPAGRQARKHRKKTKSNCPFRVLVEFPVSVIDVFFSLF